MDALPSVTHHGTKSDETDERVGRQQAQADDESIPERLEFILIETGVHDE